MLRLGPVAMVICALATGAPTLAAARDYAGNRIAVDADGNFNDPDDWAATPATLAILARQELQPHLVHYGYNNSLGANANDAYMQGQMTSATLYAAERFGFDMSDFYDLQRELPDAIDNLRRQVNLSTADDPLYIIAAGPMEFLWRVLKDADPKSRPFVTVISHSPWNNNRVWRPAMTHTHEDVKALNVNWVQIADQNKLLYTKTAWAPWHWLRDSGQARMRDIYERMRLSGKPDISDAGMAYYLVTGNVAGTPAMLRAMMGDWALPPDSGEAQTAQAENGTIHRAVVDNNHPGHTGSGFVNYRNEVGGYVEIVVNAPRASSATLTFRYANGTSANRPLQILVNGKVASASLAFGSTGGWDNWQSKSLSTNLQSGTNRIRARAIASSGGPNLDRVVVSTD